MGPDAYCCHNWFVRPRSRHAPKRLKILTTARVTARTLWAQRSCSSAPSGGSSRGADTSPGERRRARTDSKQIFPPVCVFVLSGRMCCDFWVLVSRAVHACTRDWWYQAGCYLIYSEESGGTLLENWNEDPVAEALAFFIPGMVMPRFGNTGLDSKLSRWLCIYRSTTRIKESGGDSQSIVTLLN